MSSVDDFPLVSIIILVRNRQYVTWTCLRTLSIFTDYPAYEVLVVDNNSDSDAKRMLDDAARLNGRIQKYSNKTNISFSKANNEMAKIAKGDFLLFLNNDTEFLRRSWLKNMVSVLKNDAGIAAVGPLLMYPGCEKVQSGGVKISFVNGYFSSAEEIKEFAGNCYIDCVTGAALLMRKSVFLDVGMFDENFFYGLEDVDLCLSLKKKGYKIYFLSDVFLAHHESTTRKGDESIQKIHIGRNRSYLLNKWKNYSFGRL